MQKRSPNKLAIFDFDGTLTYSDTTIGFLIYYGGYIKTLCAFLFNAPWILLACLHFINWESVKERVFKVVFGGDDFNMAKEKGDSYGNQLIPKLLLPITMDELNHLRLNGFEILLLSASCRLWLEQWCINENIELICTELEQRNGVLTGKILGSNCFGEEKVRRLKHKYDLESIDEVIAFGNHSSDFYYMRLAHKAYMVKCNQLVLI